MKQPGKKKPRGKPFKKGVSGNPSGRPAVPAEVRDACRALSLEAIQVLERAMRAKDVKARIAAANALLDRAWGKPNQPLGNDPDNPLTNVPTGQLIEKAREAIAALMDGKKS